MPTNWSEIPCSNANTDRAFNTLLDALEAIAPGIRADLKFVLTCSPPAGFCQGEALEAAAASPEHLHVDLDVPDEEAAAFKALKERHVHVGEAPEGDLLNRLKYFSNARRLRIEHARFPDEPKLSRFLHLIVHAGSNPDNVMEEDRFSVAFSRHDEPTNAVAMDSISGSRFIHSSRAGDAQPSFADALRMPGGLEPRIISFAEKIRAFRQRVASRQG